LPIQRFWPDIFGKVGTAGVSIATLDDMRVLYDGFDLCAPATSVSMTIDGPAPAILAMFLNNAIDQRLRAFAAEHGREPDDAEAAQVRAWVLAYVRGTVQADILKEDQGQNTCIFSTEFALRCMADIQQWFIEHQVRNFYSVSISGYHIAEAGANPITQLAFTLANGFIYVEAYLARSTLQALCAIYDNCNSLHTNAYDEAVTTPSARSVRRALAIQMIIDQEWGLAGNENPLQGSFILDQLTDLVEEAVLAEFDRLAERGGVLSAMETGYQRGKIQDESMLYEQRKHEGTLPIVGVNVFTDPDANRAAPAEVELARATEAEKQSQLDRLADFQARHAEVAPAALRRLKEAAAGGGNVFEALMEAVRHCSLGRISEAFFEVGGQYRRNV